MSGGVVASFIVGLLMDRIGLEFCSALTLILGMLQMVVLTQYSDHRQWMIFGFFVYVFFRQFLFPVFIASLTARLGYKYFGLLNGIGFAVSGVAQAFMPSLVRVVQGTCHMGGSEESSVSEDCEHGQWQKLHGIEFVLLGLLLLVPYFDHREKKRQERNLMERRLFRESWKNLKISSRSSPTNVSNYGSVPTNDDTEQHSVGMELDG
jgi:MFS family permease